MADETASAPNQYPLLPLRDVVVFPHMVIPLFVGRPKSIKAMEIAMEAGKSILLVAQKSAAKDEPTAEDLYKIGPVASLLIVAAAFAVGIIASVIADRRDPDAAAKREERGQRTSRSDDDDDADGSGDEAGAEAPTSAR